MLDSIRLEDMNSGFEALPCQVVLPPDWTDFFHRRGPEHWPADNRRRFVRSHFPLRVIMELAGTLPAVPRSLERHVVLMKNLSRGGAGFLHAARLYPDERVRLWLPTGGFDYTVVRCRRHNAACYEIGAELAEVG